MSCGWSFGNTRSARPVRIILFRSTDLVRTRKNWELTYVVLEGTQTDKLIALPNMFHVFNYTINNSDENKLDQIKGNRQRHHEERRGRLLRNVCHCPAGSARPHPRSPSFELFAIFTKKICCLWTRAGVKSVVK
jgi:hypothetical protein